MPTIAWWPGSVEAATVTDHVGYFADMLPTFTGLAGVTSPEGIDGIDMTPTLLGRPDDQLEHEYLYWEFHEDGMAQAVRTGSWKGVRTPVHDAIEVYDLDLDVSETTRPRRAASRCGGASRQYHAGGPSPVVYPVDEKVDRTGLLFAPFIAHQKQIFMYP